MNTMAIAISKEDKEVIDDLLSTVISFKQTLIQLSFWLIMELKKLLINFIISLGEFSPKEIREHGLEEILMKRALRFFGFESQENRVGGQSKSKKKEVTIRSVFKRVVHVLLSPVYMLILICLYIRNRKNKKNVKNNYKT